LAPYETEAPRCKTEEYFYLIYNFSLSLTLSIRQKKRRCYITLYEILKTNGSVFNQIEIAVSVKECYEKYFNLELQRN